MKKLFSRMLTTVLCFLFCSMSLFFLFGKFARPIEKDLISQGEIYFFYNIDFFNTKKVQATEEEANIFRTWMTTIERTGKELEVINDYPSIFIIGKKSSLGIDVSGSDSIRLLPDTGNGFLKAYKARSNDAELTEMVIKMYYEAVETDRQKTDGT